MLQIQVEEHQSLLTVLTGKYYTYEGQQHRWKIFVLDFQVTVPNFPYFSNG